MAVLAHRAHVYIVGYLEVIMSLFPERYILYRNTPLGTEQAGYIINAFQWGGQGEKLPIPDGCSIAPDPNGIHPIGGTYTDNTA